eukprot:TRINITY_DN4675_c0_g1_i1.p1 TRINITY_DN4675_c0_g1~~TRINITY_DN4675_c0_g1_i1.p1  ORF type:complete len:505 (+),score=208.73 TRINITY_DN4675_c0_g1_i1:69-1583(+)
MAKRKQPDNTSEEPVSKKAKETTGGWDPEFLKKFQVPEGGWKCPSCSVINGKGVEWCLCCEIPDPSRKDLIGKKKPGTEGADDGKPGFFSSLTSDAPKKTGGFNFGSKTGGFSVPKATGAPATGGFKLPSSTSASAGGFKIPKATAAPSTTGGFKFGASTNAAPKTGGFVFGKKAEEKPEAEEKVEATEEDLEKIIEMQNEKRAGIVAVAGANDADQLGNPDLFDTNKFSILPALKTKNIIKVVCGGMHSAALDVDGTAYTWGCNDDGALGREGTCREPLPVKFDEKVVELTCGDNHTLFLLENGQVMACGSFKGKDGHLGFSMEDTRIQKDPVPVEIKCRKGDKIVQIFSGDNHCAAISEEGHLYTWGYSEFGQLGRASRIRDLRGKIESGRMSWRAKRNAMVAAEVKIRDGRRIAKVLKVALGAFHSLALIDGGKVFSFGSNGYAQLGLEDDVEQLRDRTKPELIPALSGMNIVDIACGFHHSLCLTDKGEVYLFYSGIWPC